MGWIGFGVLNAFWDDNDDRLIDGMDRRYNVQYSIPGELFSVFILYLGFSDKSLRLPNQVAKPYPVAITTPSRTKVGNLRVEPSPVSCIKSRQARVRFHFRQVFSLHCAPRPHLRKEHVFRHIVVSLRSDAGTAPPRNRFSARFRMTWILG